MQTGGNPDLPQSLPLIHCYFRMQQNQNGSFSLQALTPHLGSKTVLGGLNEIGALLSDYIPYVFRWGFLQSVLSGQ